VESLRLLDWWSDQLQRCYSGKPIHPVMVALQTTIRKFELPPEPLGDLLSAFRQDRVLTRYEDESEILNYCSRSANPVGRILLRMAGVTDATAVELSDKICTGLQLANFCQDVSRDAELGRIYAPRSLWQAHGVTEEMLLARRATPELKAMLKTWVGTAGAQFLAGWALVKMVPGWLRTDVDLFVRGGLAILGQIDAASYDVWSHRPTVSKWTKGRLLASSLLGQWIGYHRTVPHWLKAGSHV
jgi:squalene synthase HpnC